MGFAYLALFGRLSRWSDWIKEYSLKAGLHFKGAAIPVNGCDSPDVLHLRVGREILLPFNEFLMQAGSSFHYLQLEEHEIAKHLLNIDIFLEHVE